MFKSWFLSQGWALLIIVLPFILPNKAVYLFFNRTVGLALRGLTLRFLTEKKVGDNVVKWILDTITTSFEATTDGIKGVNKYNQASIEAARKLSAEVNGKPSPPTK